MFLLMLKNGGYTVISKVGNVVEESTEQNIVFISNTWMVGRIDGWMDTWMDEVVGCHFCTSYYIS